MRVGDWVRFDELPKWVERLPEESRRVFRFCRGRAYRVSDIDEHGHCELDVSADVDARFGGTMNSLHIEADLLTPVEPPSPAGA